jgi:hypothetical protein
MATYTSKFSLPCEWDRRGTPGRHQQVRVCPGGTQPVAPPPAAAG